MHDLAERIFFILGNFVLIIKMIKMVGGTYLAEANDGEKK